MVLLGREVVTRTEKKTGGGNAAQDLASRMEMVVLRDEQQKRKDDRRRALKEKMQVELASHKEMQREIDGAWRQIMRAERKSELLGDVNLIDQYHRRDCDRKDAFIHQFDRDLDESESQYQHAVRAHVSDVRGLIALQQERLTALRRDFDGETGRITDEFRGEAREIERQAHSTMAEVRLLLAVVRQRETAWTKETQRDHDRLMAEVVERNLEEVNLLRLELVGQCEVLEGLFDEAHERYMSDTTKRTNHFKSFKLVAQQDSDQIRRQERRIQRLERDNRQLANRLKQRTAECGKRNIGLREETEAVHGTLVKLGAVMRSEQRMSRTQLVALAKEVQYVKERMGERLKLATHILTLAERGRRHETPKEQLPVPLVVPPSQQPQPLSVSLPEGGEAVSGEGGDREQATDAEAVRPDTAAAARARTMQRGAEWELLDNWQKKYNGVQLEKLAIKRRRDELAAENRRLKKLLKDFVSGITVSKDLMDRPNPLLVINGSISVLGGGGGGQQVTVASQQEDRRLVRM
jgi:hypothetical protein